MKRNILLYDFWNIENQKVSRNVFFQSTIATSYHVRIDTNIRAHQKNAIERLVRPSVCPFASFRDPRFERREFSHSTHFIHHVKRVSGIRTLKEKVAWQQAALLPDQGVVTWQRRCKLSAARWWLLPKLQEDENAVWRWPPWLNPILMPKGKTTKLPKEDLRSIVPTPTSRICLTINFPNRLSYNTNLTNLSNHKLYNRLSYNTNLTNLSNHKLSKQVFM